MRLLAANTIPVKATTPSFLSQLVTTNGLSNLIGWALRMLFLVAGILVLYQLLMGAFEWIQSGGEKDKLEKARKQITTSIIGLIILFAIIALVVILENIFGFGMGISKAIEFTTIGTP